MEQIDFLRILKQTKPVTPVEVRGLKVVLDKYPYFQSARAIYIKGLKGLESFKYNLELKKTAALTTDRRILFEYITSSEFSQDTKVLVNELDFIEENVVLEEKLAKTSISDKKLEIQAIEEDLGVGKPLGFDRKEVYSFNEWLKLSNNKKPIIRAPTTDQEDIISKFIRDKPKISKLDKSKALEVKVQSTQEYPKLMTETLAKIYLEQKKYDNAIKAYEILILKYPEKSGFFANQIKKIRNLQKIK